MKKFFQCEMGTHINRQMIIHLTVIWLGNMYEILGEDDKDMLSSQAGHSKDIRDTCYAIVHGMLASVTSDCMFRFGYMSEWFWCMASLHPTKSTLSLPLHTHRQLRDESMESPSSPSSSSSGFDYVKLVDTIGALFDAKIARMEEHILGEIQ
ncbi:hypothetical protein GLOTRDRAFT_131477 [Gloeophyllum trabeum ATCC 11539]|uniref:Uncharacterized protein n=1 Tax=Gloeophyllum trabeum (strain ATCC 11539 / FP-39264 / Madison 617) TaxID=670483 RepID=S7RKK0_GLOTA|nr:uncharacterized protein GLOTRDRAFT_131477 [Gloeophyllum trabeum ATCC 11539]EPQ53199.1 hypothetical protein GLOTRDRAFT_131477 [Gloeophyllum trabeum ATCC 11539]